MALRPRTAWEIVVGNNADDDACPLLSGADIVRCVDFRDWEADDCTPYFLCCWLREEHEQRLRSFLRLVTGLPSLCPSSLRKIVVQRSDFFASRTCFWHLHFPTCPSLAVLRERLNAALVALDGDPAMYEIPETTDHVL